jgi:hypothetical protein
MILNEAVGTRKKDRPLVGKTHDFAFSRRSQNVYDRRFRIVAFRLRCFAQWELSCSVLAWSYIQHVLYFDQATGLANLKTRGAERTFSAVFRGY